MQADTTTGTWPEPIDTYFFITSPCGLLSRQGGYFPEQVKIDPYQSPCNPENNLGRQMGADQIKRSIWQNLPDMYTSSYPCGQYGPPFAGALIPDVGEDCTGKGDMKNWDLWNNILTSVPTSDHTSISIPTVPDNWSRLQTCTRTTVNNEEAYSCRNLPLVPRPWPTDAYRYKSI